MNQPLKPGDPAPDFELMNQDKNKVRLADYRGKKRVALLFYPMDFSPICTEDHCTFVPDADRIRKTDDTIIFGVSTDSPYCHAAFRKQHGIPYDLLSDTSRRMVKAYGMWAGEEPYNSSKRGTVIIDTNGRIAHYEELPMREPRKVDDLLKAMAVEVAIQQRANEGGLTV